MCYVVWLACSILGQAREQRINQCMFMSNKYPKAENINIISWGVAE